MARPRKGNASAKGDSAATLGYEAQLWQMADALRGSMDAAEYKHVCLGLLFQKYLSNASEGKHVALRGQVSGRDPRALPRPGIQPRCGSAS